MKVLGLDLSSKPGWAVTEDAQKLIEYGTMFDIRENLTLTSAAKHLEDYKLLDIAEAVSLRIRSLILRTDPDLIYIEQSNQGKGLSAMKGQEFIHCSVLRIIREMGYQSRTYYIYAQSWRSLCGQKMTKEDRDHNKLVKTGQARSKIRTKHIAVRWANEKFGLKLRMKDEDQADAIGISVGGYRMHLKSKSVSCSENLEKAFN